MSANIKELLNSAKPTEKIVEPMGWLGIQTAFLRIPNNGLLMSVMFSSVSSESQQCYMSVSRLANTLGCSESAVKKGRTRLVNDGWIKIIGTHENGCAIYIMTHKAKEFLAEDAKIRDSIHQHNMEVEANRKKLIAEEYQCTLEDLSRNIKTEKHEKAEIKADDTVDTISDIPNSTKCETTTNKTTMPVHQHEEAVHETATVTETAPVAETVNVDLSNDRNYITAKRYEKSTAEFLNRYTENSRHEWTIEEVAEFYNIQPYNWKYRDFDTNKAYIKNFKGVKLTKLEFERKMLTILDTSSMKPSYATKTTSTASPVRSVIPQNIILDEEELTKEEIAEILSKMAGGNRDGSVMA